ncbi:hypothetical protein LV478_11735 [Komagataeibacter oboediens]|uniref:hypothetical protein n=1 Tax=Komagataeibacter oboediens TaxID=65958 RepID=UPI0023DBCD3E|nr:hypothetical protein [Komagataeibacter oboediens]WEQ51201.1 hypothetical protein LV478_11735 [Komagataeibacter oboediens]
MSEWKPISDAGKDNIVVDLRVDNKIIKKCVWNDGWKKLQPKLQPKGLCNPDERQWLSDEMITIDGEPTAWKKHEG